MKKLKIFIYCQNIKNKSRNKRSFEEYRGWVKTLLPKYNNIWSLKKYAGKCYFDKIWCLSVNSDAFHQLLHFINLIGSIIWIKCWFLWSSYFPFNLAIYTVSTSLDEETPLIWLVRTHFIYPMIWSQVFYNVVKYPLFIATHNLVRRKKKRENFHCV